MSNETKETVGTVLNWILKGLTALGGIFLIQVYSDIKYTRAAVDELRTDRSVQEVRLDSRMKDIGHELKDHDRRITDVERWRENTSKNRTR